MISSPEYNASMRRSAQEPDRLDVARPVPSRSTASSATCSRRRRRWPEAIRGLWALRIPLEHLGARVYPDMFSLAQAHEAFGPTGRLANDLLQKRFDENIGCFLDLVEAALRYPGLKKQWVEFLGEKPNSATDRTETSETAAA
jgi:hypothetical protein